MGQSAWPLSKMADNYYDTALQMMADSQLLHENSRWHTSCYLAGYVVECGLKAIAEKGEFSLATLRRPPYGHKFNKLLIDVMAITITTDLTKGRTFPDIARSTLVARWDPQERYNPTWCHTLAESTEFQETATQVNNYLLDLKSDGDFA